MPEPTLLWSYGVVHANADVAGLAPAGGVAGAAVERVEAAGLALLASRVPAAEFRRGALHRHLDDPAWLERTGGAHEHVLAEAVRLATVVPLPLCTVHPDAASARAALEADREALAEALCFLAGREQWGAALLVDPERLRAHAAQDRDAHDVDAPARVGGSACLSDGSAYLARRRAEHAEHDAAVGDAAWLARVAHARLADGAVDAVTRPPRTRALPRGEGEPVIDPAYLVDADATESLRDRAAAIERDFAHVGARVELTGPWPAYDFLPRTRTRGPAAAAPALAAATAALPRPEEPTP